MSETPKPQVKVPTPTNDFGGAQLIQRSKQWYDIVHLALQTDSTRVISLWLGSQDRTGIERVNIAHHGQEPAMLEQLSLIEEAEVKALGELLTKLKARSDEPSYPN